MKWKLVEIHHDFSKVSLEQLEVIYKSVGWEKHTQVIIHQVFEASNIYAFATVKGEVVGFWRNKCYEWYICYSNNNNCHIFIIKCT